MLGVRAARADGACMANCVAWFSSCTQACASAPVPDQCESNCKYAYQRDLSERMPDELVKRIGEMGLSARRAVPGEEVPRDAVVVTGYFVDIDAGNRMQRLVIGLGAGESQVDAQVQVRQRTRRGYAMLV